MPTSAVFAFTDPYEHQHAIRSGDVEIVVTRPGDYRAELKRLNLHKLWMQRTWQNLPFVAPSSLREPRVSYLFLAHDRQPPVGVFGKEVSAGEMCGGSIGDEYHVRTSAESCFASMSLSLDDFAAAGSVLIGGDIVALSKKKVVRPPPQLMSRLLNLHQAACDLTTTAPEIFAHPEVSKSLEQALIPALVACLSNDATRPSAVRGQRVMCKFEELIKAAPGTPLYLIDVCKAIGVTSRTLRYHCQEFLGMSPQRYLWHRRMTLARRQLMRLERGATTVTNIATGCGFGELGRFAVQYRVLFGETPSETLRRPAG